MAQHEDSPTVVTPAVLRQWPLPRSNADKNSRGRALVIGGSVSNPGGAMLAARAAMRSGAGKIRLVVPEPVAIPLAIAMPEAMVRGAACTSDGDLSPDALPVIQEMTDGADAVLVGPGMLEPRLAAELMEAASSSLRGTVVLDALALAWLTEDPTRGRRLDSLLLSPNLSELAITLGEEADAVESDPVAAVRRLAELTGAVVTCGGSSTWIATPAGDLWRSDEGSRGLGVSGSGDVKAGVMLGLAARGAPPEQAAVWAAYLHGTVGGRLASRFGPTGYLAGELPGELPRALLEIGED